MDIQKTLEKYKIIPNSLKDQFFLADEKIIEKIVEFADLNKNDVVLEIGAGPGNLTRKLSDKAKKVIAFEIDKKFKPLLSKLPENTDVLFKDAWDFVQLQGKFKQRKIYNKVVSNPPFSLIEPLLHNLTFLEYDKVILLIPVRFVKTIKSNPIFSSFFDVKILIHISKENFYPIPKTNTVGIELIKLPDPISSQNSGLFLKQYMYRHESQLVKNSLMEGIIKYMKIVRNENVTKNEARQIIIKGRIAKGLLEKTPSSPTIYQQVKERFDKL